jgi:hypothetical protein
MASGNLVDINNFTENDVILEDIAHHLSKLQRFNGATPLDTSYTVGEHCISLSKWFYIRELIEGPSDFLLSKVALLHDASEAYLSDIVSPVKRCLVDYKKIEERVQSVIFSRFGITKDMLDIVESCIGSADKRILIDEVEALMPSKLDMYIKETNLSSLGCRVYSNHHPSTTKQCFLMLAEKLEIV